MALQRAYQTRKETAILVETGTTCSTVTARAYWCMARRNHSPHGVSEDRHATVERKGRLLVDPRRRCRVVAVVSLFCVH